MAAGPDMMVLPPSSIDLESIFSTRRKARMSATTSSKKNQNCGIGPKMQSEWKNALREVKREYFIGKYRSCAARCDDLLAGAKLTKTAVVIHLVYLHFYAASALEQQVRSLHHTSPYRTTIIDKASDHYRRAALLADAENDNIKDILGSRSQRSGSSASSHSPSLSLSSGSTRLSSSSPTPVEEKTEKCVRFKETSTNDVFIRPDSPTLGFDDGFCAEAEGEPLDLSHSSHAPVPTPSFFEQTHILQRHSSLLTTLHHQITTIHLPSLALPPAPPPVSNDEMRAADIRRRIERLRQDGWRGRGRFDAGRYERLREAAAVDLMEA